MAISNAAQLYRLPCPMCGEELRLHEVGFGHIAGCPHCGEEVVPQQAETQPVEGPSDGPNLVDRDAASALEPAGLIGDWSAQRFFAAQADIVCGSIAALIVAKTVLEPYGAAAQGLGAVAVFFLFFLVCEGVWGRTPGKYVCGLRIVNRDGRRPTWKQTIIRSLWRLFEVNPLLIGGLPAAIAIFGSRSRQRLGDMMAGTYVVSDD